MLFFAVNFLLFQDRHQPDSNLLSVQMGDLGTGYALLRAGQTFQNTKWLRAGLQILGASAGKMLSAGIDLPLGMLNGAAGASIAFDKIHSMTANPLFAQAAGSSHAALLAAQLPPDCNVLSGLKPDLGFGAGISGIGAALIQKLHPQEVDLQPLLWLL